MEILRTIHSESFTSTFPTGISSKMQESSTNIIGRTKTEDIRKQDAESIYGEDLTRISTKLRNKEL